LQASISVLEDLNDNVVRRLYSRLLSNNYACNILPKWFVADEHLLSPVQPYNCPTDLLTLLLVYGLRHLLVAIVTVYDDS